MLNYMIYLSIVIGLFAIGDWLGLWTKAKLSSHCITMSCLTEIPIPRGKYHEIKDLYLEHAFQNKQVIV